MGRPRMHQKVKLIRPRGSRNRAYKNEVGEIINISPRFTGTIYKLRMPGGHEIECEEDEFK